MVRVRPASLIGEVIDLVVFLVILVQEPLHLGPGIPVNVFCSGGEQDRTDRKKESERSSLKWLYNAKRRRTPPPYHACNRVRSTQQFFKRNEDQASFQAMEGRQRLRKNQTQWLCLTYASRRKPVNDYAARDVRQVQIESILGTSARGKQATDKNRTTLVRPPQVSVSLTSKCEEEHVLCLLVLNRLKFVKKILLELLMRQMESGLSNKSSRSGVVQQNA